MSFRSRLGAWCSVVGIAGVLAGLAGCGGPAGPKVAPVQGKITFEGQPVKNGAVIFQPVKVEGVKEGLTGKSASGQVKEDGTFVLSTHGNNDGAVIGKHKPLFMPLSRAAESYDDKPEPSPYLGCVPKATEVEVKAGPNQIDIELVRGLGAAPAAPAAPAAEKAKE